MNNNDLREKLIIPAVVGALYAALTMLLAPISYGNLQFRISEALCVLPVFFPYTSVGLFLGCALANMISAAGILDVVFGSLATLCAGLCAAACGREARRTGAMPSVTMRVLACLSPVVWNGVVIGTTCLLQFAVSMWLDSRYEKGLGRYYYWMIWYPLAFWVLNVFTTLVAIPKVLFRGRQRATWKSPDRGLQP